MYIYTIDMKLRQSLECAMELCTCDTSVFSERTTRHSMLPAVQGCIHPPYSEIVWHTRFRSWKEQATELSRYNHH